jgi:hypothetical protein
LPWPAGPTPQSAPEGLTGFEFFAEFRTIIDYERRVLRFEPFDAPLPSGSRLPLVMDDHDLYVTAKVDGRPGLFRIDTGDGGSVTLFRTFAAALGLGAGAPQHQIAGGVGGGLAVTKTRLSSFQLGDETVGGVRADISRTNAGSFASRTLAGNLGAKLLHCFTLAIDFRARTLVLEKTAATKACLAASAG